jgi:hypothetical protein
MSEKGKKPLNPFDQKQALNKRLKNLYSKALKNYYITAFVGFMIGSKLCDIVFYDPTRLEVIREEMEDEFWKANGKPKVIKPQIVPSFADPSKTR